MTHNQIDYWNYVENARHNRAMENLNAQDVEIRSGTLAEATRHNVAEEELGAANIRQMDISSLRSTAAQRYASELGYSSSIYGADTTRYGYDLNALNQKYNADLSAQTQRYSADSSRSATEYSADRNAQANERGQTLNALYNFDSTLLGYAADWYKQNTDVGRWIGKFNVNLGSNNSRSK